MRSPCFAYGRLFVYENFYARGRQWSAVKVERAVDLGPRRESRVNSRAAEKVQGHDCLWEKAVPEVKWEIFVGAA
jgi:hypothetical protein